MIGVLYLLGLVVVAYFAARWADRHAHRPIDYKLTPDGERAIAEAAALLREAQAERQIAQLTRAAAKRAEKRP